MAGTEAEADTLVLSGGGPDGVAFVGALRYLLESGRVVSARLRNVVGCSVGAVVAFLIALGMTPDDLVAFVERGLASGALASLDLAGILTAPQSLGIDDGERIIALLRDELTKRGIDADASFLRFAKVTGKNLVVAVSNLSSCRRELLSIDTRPDMPVLVAVRMSISIPFLFQPVVWQGNLYVDGGMLDVCPVSHIEACSDATNTIALMITLVPPPTDTASSASQQHQQPHQQPQQQPIDIQTYIKMLLRVMTMRQHVIPCRHAAAAASAAANMARVQVINIPTLISTEDPVFSFSLSTMQLTFEPGAIARMTEHGYECVRRSLANK